MSSIQQFKGVLTNSTIFDETINPCSATAINTKLLIGTELGHLYIFQLDGKNKVYI